MRALSIICVACLLAVWCTSLLAEKKVSDDHIYDQVRLKLAHDTTVKGGGIEVEVHDGVVTLRGKVDQAKAKTKAERLAKKVSGVKKVINQLRVEKP
jgi:osmotically-inducible protein OsmY